jgi:hypothetical protein
MPEIPGHHRSDGTYVRPHYRHSTPRSEQGTGRVWVKGHYRNGRFVRGHWRHIGGSTTSVSRSAPAADTSVDWGWYLIGLPILILIALAVLSTITS